MELRCIYNNARNDVISFKKTGIPFFYYRDIIPSSALFTLVSLLLDTGVGEKTSLNVVYWI